MMTRLVEHPIDDNEVCFTLTIPRERAEAVRRHLASLLDVMGLDEAAAAPEAAMVRPDEAPGVCLKRLRLEHGLTQKQLAAHLKVNQARVSDYEQGVRAIPFESAGVLAGLFNVSARFFVA